MPLQVLHTDLLKFDAICIIPTFILIEAVNRNYDVFFNKL